MLNPSAHTDEMWKPVVGYEGLYEVSDAGRVRSVDRINTNRNGIMRNLRGRILKPKTVRFGYQQVHLSKGNRKGMKSVHRLVLEAFIGPCPDGHEACHNDGDAANNHKSNLRWGTKSSNQLDRQKHGTHNQCNKTHCPRGHPLEEPNLVAYRSSLGQRVCLACDRASSYISRHQEYRDDLQKVSDRYYESLIRKAGEIGIVIEDGQVKA